MYCSTDMMTDEDKEATIKNGRVPFSDEPFCRHAQDKESAMAGKEGLAIRRRGRARRHRAGL